MHNVVGIALKVNRMLNCQVFYVGCECELEVGSFCVVCLFSPESFSSVELVTKSFILNGGKH